MGLGATGLYEPRGKLALGVPLLGGLALVGGGDVVFVTSGELWDQSSDSGDGVYTDGGRTFGVDDTLDGALISSFTPDAGKWYFEVEWVVPGAVGSGLVRNIGVGFQDAIDASYPGGVYGAGQPSNELGGSSYQNNGAVVIVENLRTENVSTSLDANQAVDGSVIGIAVDIDNALVYYSFDDSWLNGADPEAGTGGEDISGDTDPGTVSVFVNARDLNQRLRLRTSANQLTGTVPTGYNRGWGAA